MNFKVSSVLNWLNDVSLILSLISRSNSTEEAKSEGGDKIICDPNDWSTNFDVLENAEPKDGGDDRVGRGKFCIIEGLVFDLINKCSLHEVGLHICGSLIASFDVLSRYPCKEFCSLVSFLPNDIKSLFEVEFVSALHTAYASVSRLILG